MRHPKLTGTERAIFAELDGKQGFLEICRKAGIDPLSVARTLQLLRQMGAVKISRAKEPAATGEHADRGGDESAVRACVDRRVKVMVELAAPIVAIEGGDGIRERLQSVLEEASHRFPVILGGVQVAAGGAVDPEEITRRALQFPGDRENEVGLALSELIAYLEFELRNHPTIEDPDQFLEGLEELRAG
jgi:hypothetical protein